MTNEEMAKEIIGELINAHHEIIMLATKGTVTDEKAFQEWAANVAKLHAQITIKALLNDQIKSAKSGTEGLD